jgi:hypothetical protein
LIAEFNAPEGGEKRRRKKGMERGKVISVI